MTEASAWYDETYTERVNLTAQQAGASDEGWNARYRAAAAENGLLIIPFGGGVALLENSPMYAPMPYGGAEAWEMPSLLVLDTDVEDYTRREPVPEPTPLVELDPTPRDQSAPFDPPHPPPESDVEPNPDPNPKHDPDPEVHQEEQA